MFNIHSFNRSGFNLPSVPVEFFSDSSSPSNYASLTVLYETAQNAHVLTGIDVSRASVLGGTRYADVHYQE